MRKLATKLTPAIKAWIKNEFGSDFYETSSDKEFFCFPNFVTEKGFQEGYHLNWIDLGYTEVSEQEFLAEFEKPKPIIQTRSTGGKWVDVIHQDCYRIKPTPRLFKRNGSN